MNKTLQLKARGMAGPAGPCGWLIKDALGVTVDKLNALGAQFRVISAGHETQMAWIKANVPWLCWTD